MKAEWKNRIVESGSAPASSFVAHPLNARRHPVAQRDALRGSLDSVGWVAPVVRSARSGKLLDGHARIEEAIERGGDAQIPYVTVDITEQEERFVLTTFDPIGSLATYDADALEALLDGFETPDAALRSLVDELAKSAGIAKVGGGGDEFDTTPEVDGPTRTQVGDLWVIGGKHRLVCGDSTKAEDVARLVRKDTVDLVHIDPPYGINIIGKIGGDKPFGKIGGGKLCKANYYQPIHGDDRPFDPQPFLDMAPAVIVWGANYLADRLPISSSWICWDKREAILRNNFADCELAWCSKGGPARVFHHLWSGLFKGSQHGESRSHPTEKPVALFQEIGNMYALHGVWLDLFAGTGAQLIAAHRAGAIALVAEIEPRYCDVILKRAEAERLTVEKAEDGATAKTN